MLGTCSDASEHVPFEKSMTFYQIFITHILQPSIPLIINSYSVKHKTYHKFFVTFST